MNYYYFVNLISCLIMLPGCWQSAPVIPDNKSIKVDKNVLGLWQSNKNSDHILTVLKLNKKEVLIHSIAQGNKSTFYLGHFHKIKDKQFVQLRVSSGDDYDFEKAKIFLFCKYEYIKNEMTIFNFKSPKSKKTSFLNKYLMENFDKPGLFKEYLKFQKIKKIKKKIKPIEDLIGQHISVAGVFLFNKESLSIKDSKKWPYDLSLSRRKGKYPVIWDIKPGKLKEGRIESFIVTVEQKDKKSPIFLRIIN